GGPRGARAPAAAGGAVLPQPFDASPIGCPAAKPFLPQPVAHGVTPGGWWYAANNFCAAEHGGTPLDAPIHFAADRWTADQVPLERLVGPAVVVHGAPPLPRGRG